MQKLVLASSSPYRKELLSRITQQFICDSPNINEQALENESPIELVIRLSIAKAKEVAKNHPQALIIGSDQVCEFNCPKTGNTLIMGKPHTHEKAVEHLRMVSGRNVTLQTGLALFNAASKSIQYCVVSFQVSFRELSDDLIESYLLADQPYECAGAVKAESLGIILIEKMSGEDPNALIGLPLIQLTTMLNNEGFDLFHKKTT